jgi:hypothetical protein
MRLVRNPDDLDHSEPLVPLGRICQRVAVGPELASPAGRFPIIPLPFSMYSV